MTRRRWYVLAGIVAGLVVAASLPPVQLRASALAVTAETIGVDLPRPFAPQVRRIDTIVGGVRGRLYTPGPQAPSILFVPGATPDGLDDPRVDRAARALARADRAVFVPHLDLYEERFTEADIERLVAAAAGLASLDRVRGSAAILGFSYGGSLALIAAADTRIRDRLTQVAVFGAYYDLVGVVQAVTTGVAVVGDERIPYVPPPIAWDVVRMQALELLPADLHGAFDAALDGQIDPDLLPADVRAVYDLITNRDPDRVADLVDALPPEARLRLARFSPATVADAISAPVVALHSTDDPAVPFAELLRLEQAMPAARTVRVSLFEHVDVRVTAPLEWARALPDLWRTARFTAWVLEAQR